MIGTIVTMHTFGETNTGVPAFLAKLWRLVEDGETNSLIYWSAVSGIWHNLIYIKCYKKSSKWLLRKAIIFIYVVCDGMKVRKC